MSYRLRLFLVLAAIVHAALLYLTLTRQLDFLFSDAAHRAGPGSDFVTLFAAGAEWSAGNSIYGNGPDFGFRYHPAIAMTLFAWLSRFDCYTAFCLWIGLSELLLVTVVCMMRKLAQNDKQFVIVCAFVACFSPLYLELFMGNANAVAGCVLVMAYALFAKHRLRLALLAFVVSCLIKPVGVILLPLLLLKGYSRGVAVAALALIVAGLPYWLWHAGDLPKVILINATDQGSSAGFLVHAGNQGFCALLMRVGAIVGDLSLGSLRYVRQLPVPFQTLMYAWPVILAATAIWITRRFRSAKIEVLCFLYIASYLLGYKDVWEHSYSILLFALPPLYFTASINRKALLSGAILLALPTALAFYDIDFSGPRIQDPDWHWSPAVSVLHHATKPIGLVILYIAAIAAIVRSDSTHSIAVPKSG